MGVKGLAQGTIYSKGEVLLSCVTLNNFKLVCFEGCSKWQKMSSFLLVHTTQNTPAGGAGKTGKQSSCESPPITNCCFLMHLAVVINEEALHHFLISSQCSEKLSAVMIKVAYEVTTVR